MVGPPLNTRYEIPLKPVPTIKFLCSYGGKIVPRHPDGKLRYQGGETRVLAVHRSVSFSELLVKLGDLCGTLVTTFRCQLPTDDLDALVSIKSDEDLTNLIEEYDRSASLLSSVKIRAFFSIPKKLSPTSSTVSSSSASSATLESASPQSPPATSAPAVSSAPRFRITSTSRCIHQNPKPVGVMKIAIYRESVR